MTAEPNNITSLDDERLIREGESAVDLYNKDIYSARARIMPMAHGLLAARRKYPADRDFGDWLQGSSYREIEKDDRAALIKIGEHDEFATKFMRSTNLMSPRTIWDAVRELLPPPVSHDAKPPAAMPSAQKLPPETATTVKDDKPLVKNTAGKPDAPTLRRGSPILGQKRGKEIYDMFENKNARDVLSRIARMRGGQQIWNLVVTAFDAGLIHQNNRGVEQPTLILLFPDCPTGFARGYRLDNQRQRQDIRNVLLPAMIACRDKLLENPDRIRDILANYENEQRAKQQQITSAEKRAVAVKSMPSSEQELVMFGQVVWPRLDINQGEYDYDQVRAAIWTFRDLESWNQLAKESHESHARRIRNLFRYPGEYLQRTDRDNRMTRIFGLIVWFSHLMEKNPTAECKWPPYPHVEGHW